MRYCFRRATDDDIRRILPYTTETSKVDWDVVRQSNEILAFTYKDEPLMILGLVHFPTGTYDIHAALWGLFRNDIDPHRVALIRACQDLLFDRVGYKFTAMIDINEKKFVRFAEYFGFEATKELAELNGKLYRYYVKET